MKTKKYQLIISHNQKTETHILDKQKPLKIKAQKNTVYKIVDENGEVLHNPVVKTLGDDVYVYLPDDTSASLLLENFQKVSPITDINTLTNLNASLATQGDVVVSTFWESTASKMAMSAMGLAGTLAIVNQGKSNNHDNNAPVPVSAKVVSVNTIQSIGEGDTLTVAITLSNANGNASVPFALSGLATNDYDLNFSNGVTQNTDGTLNIPQGVTKFTVTLPIVADEVTEGNETLTLKVGEQSKEVVVNDTSITPVVTPPTPPTPIPAKVANIDVSATVNENETLTATITLDNANGAENVAFAISGLTADDYGTLVFNNGVTQNSDGTLNIPQGITEFTVSLPIVADEITEGDETLKVTVGEQTKEVVVNDTSITPVVVPPTPPAPIPAKVASVDIPTNINENETLTATITLDNANGTENVPFAITGLMADDYGTLTFSNGVTQNSDGTLNIPQGITEFTVSSPIIADNQTEGDETLKLTIGEQTKEVVINDTSTTLVVTPPPPTPIPAKVASVDIPTTVNENETLTATIKLDNSNGAENVAFTLSGLQADDYGTLVFSNGVTQNTDGTLTIPQGITEFTVSLPIVADEATEGDETLTIKVGEQSKEVVVNDTSTTPIVVPPPPPAPIPAKVANVDIPTNINENETLTATVTLDNSNGAENITFAISGLTTDDYGTLTFSNSVTQNTDGTLNIPRGVTEFTVTLPIIADEVTEGNETLKLTVGEQEKEVVIADTSITPVVVPPAPIPAKVANIDIPANINENEILTATITLDNANGAENIAFNLSGLQTDDYGTLTFSNGVTQNSDGTLNIPQGVTEFTVTLSIIADNQTEGDETLKLTVGEQSKEVIINDTSTTPIVPPPPPPTPIPAKVANVDISATVNESETLTATITLDNSNGAENIPFAITGLTADDYGTLVFSNGVTQNTDGTLNIPQGVTKFTVSLPIVADEVTEGNETLTLKVGEQSKEVIINDTSITPVVVPPAPIPAKVASVDIPTNINENETLTVTVKLDNSNGAENITFAISGLTADDYDTLTFSNGVTQNSDGTLNIPQGITEFTVSLPIVADQTTEGNETLTLKVGEQEKEVVIADTSITPVVPPAPIPAKVTTVEVAPNANEGQDVVATVTLDNSNGAENVAFNLSGLQTDDYSTLTFSNGVTQNTDGTLNIPKGVTSFAINLPIIADNQTEGNETLTLKIGEQSKEVIINDTSTTPVVVPPAPIPAKVVTVEVTPNANEGQDVVATVTLDNSNGAENVAFTLSGLQADDYGTLTFSNGVTQNSDGTLTIPQGVTTFTVSLPIIADETTEGNETLTLKVGERIKEVVINDTSTTPVAPPPTPTPAKVASVDIPTNINENETLTATVTLDNSNGAENIAFNLSGLTADDYGTLVFSNGVTQNSDSTLNIPQGVTTFTVTLPILADQTTEGNETLTLKVGEQEKEVVVNDTSTTPVAPPPPTPTPAKVASVDIPTNINENETLTATVTLDNSNGAENVAFAISGLTTDDYGTLTFNNGVTQNTDGTLNIPQGVTTFTVSLPIVADEVTEGNETLTLKVGEQSKEVIINDTSTTPVPPPPTPTIPLEITINAIDDGVINIADKALSFTLTGTVNFDPTTTEQQVIVKIGGQDHPATLTGNTWTLDVSGETLAFAEGSQTLTAILTAKDHTGASVSTNATGGYNVDTQIETPVITFDNLATDNIINLAESEQNLVVSGTVENAKDGDLVKVIIGGVSQDVPVQGGKFSLTVAGSTLKNHTSISATVITTDTAGNTAKGEKDHSYEVDTIAPTPKITLNPITGDNRIDLSESAKPTTTITGNIGNFVKTDQNEFVLICLCSTCANNNQKTVEAKLNDDGTFSADIATDELTKYDSVSATIKSTDKAGNTGQDSASQTYTVEKPVTPPPPTAPAIILNPIAGDNIVNSAEFNYGSANPNIAITGKIERADVATSTVKLEFYKAGVLAKTVDAELGADGVYTYRISGAELHRSYDTVKAILTTGGQSYDHSQSYKAAAFSPKWGNPALVPTAVSDDNVIDQNDTWHDTTTITGTFNSIRSPHTAQGIENAVDITVTVNGKPYATTVTGQTGTFSVNVKTSDLLADTDKVADISAYLYDNAGNNAGGAIRATLGYTVNDKHINQPIVTVNPIDNINIAYQTANPSTTLTGTFELDGDVALANAPLTIDIGGQSFTAQKTVTSSGNGQKTIGTWTLDVPTQTLINANGNLTAKLSATDHTGNQAQADTPATYKVDVNAPSVEVKLNAITGDNAITPDEINDTFTITGTVTGEFVASDKVTLKIGNETYTLDVVNGEFSQAVPKAVILANTAVSASLSTQDTLGNTGSDDDSLTYSVTTKDIKIEFDPITTDNLINVSEQSTPIDVSGKVTGADAKAGQTVEIKFGEHTFTTTVNPDFTFKTPIDGQLLAKHQGYTLSAQVLDNGEFLASNTHNYDVQNDVSASIQITTIGDNTSDNGVADGFGSVRLNGKLALNDSIFAQGYNSDSLEAIVVKIGDKSFNAGFNRDDMSFHIDLSKSEAEALQGQAISYEFITSGRLYYLAGTGDTKTVRQVGARDGVAQSELGKISVEWQDNTKAQDGVTTLSTPAKTTAITGVVAGSAQVGDDITVNVGGQNYTTKVQNGNAFMVNVDSETLAKHTGNITATLAAKDLEGNSIRVSDVAIYHNAGQTTGDFVSKHTHTNPADRKMKHTDDDYNFAYMIDSVASNYRGGFLHTMHTPFGGFTDNGTPAKIKYYFATQAETTSPDWQYGGRGSVGEGSTRDFSDNLKTFIRNSLDKFSAVSNIEFEEVNSYQEVGNGGINFIYGDTIGGFASSGAFAFAGGNVVFDTANFSDTANPGNYHHYLAIHELFHTFSGRHTDGVFTNYGFATPEDYTSEFSVMSYSPDYHWNLGFRDLSLYDVMYMHYRFGVAKTVNAGDDVYGFGNYASLIQDGTIYVADAGGVDTFDASYEKEGVTVNLTPGSWIYHTSQKSDTFVIKNKTEVEGNQAFFANQDLSGYTLSGNAGKHTHTEYVKGQGFIGYGTQIENLKGSNFADVLTGNNANNNIFGNDGDDKIDGGLGDDYLDGGAGNDTLIGGQGNDSYVIDSTGDTITELAGEGMDTVYSYINYNLIDNLEHLTLLGTDNINATGNSENNTLIGNSGNNTLIGGAGDDTLDGGRGNDTLTGGDGADYFRFSTLLDGSVDTITDFDVANDKIVLDDAIFTALAGQTSVGDFVKYDKDTGKLSYDADGAGVGNEIHFATLNVGLDESQIVYQII